MNESDLSIPALLVSLRVRYPDLITQRLLKATQQGKPAPHNKDELDVLAAHCTEAEDAAIKGRTAGRQIRCYASA